MAQAELELGLRRLSAYAEHCFMKKTLPGKFTLADADISSQRSVSRRSMLGALGLGLGAAAAVVVSSPGSATAQGSGCTDNDRGRNEDPPNRGRRCSRAPMTGGCTDNDRGPNEDQPGAGKWCWI
jgi:hypothetical protein